MSTEPVVPYTLDDYFKTTPIGSVDKAISDNLYGINHRQTSGVIATNKDHYGYTFFTRPQLNLQIDNISNIRFFYPLLSDNEKSMQRFVRCTLDPRQMYGYRFSNTKSIQPIGCPVVDELQAFIPVLTNNVLSVSGWPDVVAPTFDSKKGLYNEVYSQVDGITRNFESFDLDVTFRNTRGDPILYMFYIWLHYSALVFEGKLLPYPDFVMENEIDYNTRIYRLVMDSTKNVVTKITATGASFPISVPTGSFFDFNHEKPFNDQNKEITIRFRSMGTDYLDDILIYEFNATGEIFNPDMADGVRQVYMTPVDRELLPLFNNRGYPRIDPETRVLEWWVSNEYYIQKTREFINMQMGIADNEEIVG